MSSKSENADSEQVIRDLCQPASPPNEQKQKKTQGKPGSISPEPSTSKETPKRRGRPKKVVVEESSKTECEELKEAKDKDDQEFSSEKVVRKKRGRRPKNKDQKVEPKRKRARKKKADDGDDENYDEIVDSANFNSGYKTKSGRVVNNRKRNTDDESDTDQVTIRSFNDVSKLDEDQKKLYEKYKELADVWVVQLNKSAAKCPWCSIQYKKLKTILKHYDKCNDTYRNGFNCSECGKNFKLPGSLNYHMLSIHTNTAVQKENETTILKQLLRQRKKLSCDVESCDRSFTTVPGYLYHKKRCGVEGVSPVYTCTFCGKTYRSDGGLKYHINTNHSVKEPKPKATPAVTDDIEDVGTDSSGKRRRSAAHKAMKSMKELKDKGYVENKVTEKDGNSRYDFHLFTSPTIVIDAELLEKWKGLFALKQRVVCPFSCGFSSVAVLALKDHYNACKENPNFANCEPYRCNLCGKEYTIKPSILSHVRFTHTPDERQKYFTEHDIVESESSESEHEDEGDDEDDDDNDDNINDDLDSIEDCDDDGLTKSSRYGFTKGPSVLRFHKWKKVNHCKADQRLFHESSHQLCKWKLLSESDAAKVEPKCLKSPRFKVRVDNGSVEIEKVKYDKEEEPFTLERYGVLTQSDKKGPETMFVGGPVWAMAWCPIPHGNNSANQYAAISCHQSLDSTHKCCTRYEYPGVIQIWNFGCLSENGKYKTPYLSYGLAHNCGAIWDLKWCPSGCWDNPANNEDGSISRLGVFGVACSNSTVCLFAVPHEEALSNASVDSKPGFYDVEPTLTLKPATTASDWSMIGQCWCLDWLPCQPHNKIAAGFSNGLIAIWDLTTSSPLLRDGGCSTGTSLYPYKTFLAHGNQVSGISWCPTDPNFLASVGYDKKMVFWNLRDVSEPLLLRERPQPLACRWTVHTKALVTSHDTIIGGGSVYCQDYGAFNLKPQTVIRKETCMLALDMNNWLDSIVCGDILGDVRCQTLRVSKKTTYHWNYILPVYRTTVIDLNNKDISQEGAEPDKNGDDDAANLAKICSPDLTSAYNDVTLVFHDAIKSTVKKTASPIVKRFYAQDKLISFQFHKPFLASIQRTSWNPNLCSVGWILTGGQSGLVRAHYMKGLFDEHLGEQIKSVLKKS